MRTIDSIEADWQALLSQVSAVINLEATAKTSGALVRRRCVGDAATLLRLALAYGPGGMSLRSAAAWAGLNDVANLSDVGLLKRLRGAADWLGDLAGALLKNAAGPGSTSTGRRLRIADGSSIGHPGGGGINWRLHATYEPALARFTHFELGDIHSAEGFSHVPLRSGDIALGDRAYGRAPALKKVLDAGADFVVRVGWSTIRLTSEDGEVLDWNTVFASMQHGDICERKVFVEHAGPKGRGQGKPIFHARLVVQRKDATGTEKAEKTARRDHQRRRNQKQLQPMTITSAGFLLLLTSLSPEEMDASQIVGTYRLRWQIEVAFKRLKSGLGIHKLPAKDPQLARSWLMAHLIMALMIDEAITDVLDSPPWGAETGCCVSVPVETS
ncbi:transposase [Sinorhizobium fredii]|uniref:transposase n=1 Tax=Rhizobium fredii TaxID=380 RepID=UPI0004AE361A|nr:transposase [Sinorhizobium fredii]AWI62517.1 hypothetical protein AB395_00006895 [Sinorhizobium fredii CCBAU 45436]